MAYKIEATIRAVAIAIQARVPVLLTGNPGAAKTSIVTALFRDLCREHHTAVVALHEPPDFGGLPTRAEASDELPPRAEMLPQAWQLRLARVTGDGLAGLFLDELTNGAPQVRAAALRGICEGAWGELVIPNLTIAAAANPPDIAEGGYSLGAQLANRFCHIDWSIDPGWWCEQCLANFPPPRAELVPRLPAAWHAELVRVRATVTGFIYRRPALLNSCPGAAAERSGAWPSERTWTLAMQVWAAAASVGYAVDPTTRAPTAELATLVSGLIGGAAATELWQFVRELDLPDPEELLKNPCSLRLSPRGDIAYATVQAVVAAVLQNNTNERWHAAFAVIAEVVRQGAEGLAASACMLLGREANRPADWNGRAPVGLDAMVPLARQAGKYN